MNEKLEKLNRQKTAAEKKLIAAQHREKQLEHERKRLTRSERTHRLCTRAGMLEKFLREPTRICPKCKQEKPLSEFGFRQMENGEIRNQSWCKDCRSSY